MARFSPQLMRLLLIRGVARSLAPIAILCGIYYWWLIGWYYAVIFALLTVNYLVIYVRTWIPTASLGGFWRIRPWQTLLLVANAIALPIVFKKTFGVLPWGFIAITVLFFIGLYVATYILFYLQDRSPMGGIAGARTPSAPAAPPDPPPAEVR